MILDHEIPFSLMKIRQQIQNLDTNSAIFSEFALKHVSDFLDIMQVYRGAMQEAGTKLEILDEEYSMRLSHNPIHHMERRLKSVGSIMEKMERRGFELTLESLKKNVYDIAGIRVVCNYVDDVYAVSKALCDQDDIEVALIKDYIANPKETGYRSLHVICMVPVYLSSGCVKAPVEVQFRTIAMDYWASLEHKLRYKSILPIEERTKHSKTLQDCAKTLAKLEDEMQEVQRDLISTQKKLALESDSGLNESRQTNS